jgi:hypothetical protein
MLALKLICLWLSSITAIVVSLLDYFPKFKDARTSWHKKTRKWLLILFVTSLLSGTVLVYWDHLRQQTEAACLRVSLENIQHTADAGNKAAERRSRQMTQQLEEIKRRLAPFEAIASQLYPSLAISDALLRLAEAMKTLEQRVKVNEEKTATLDQRSQPRSITDEARVKALDILRTAPGQEVCIESLYGDQEAFQLAEKIKEIFGTAGWKVLGVYIETYTKPVYGVCTVVRNEQLTARLVAVARAVQALELDTDPAVRLDPNVPPGRVVVRVGARK